MSYPNGQPYHTSQSYSGQNQNNIYGTAARDPRQAHRSSSFDAGDDTRLLDQNQNQQPTGHAYGTAPSIYGQTLQSPIGTGQSLQFRSAQQSSLAGYQHGGQSAYNPAQFPQQSQYNPQSYGSPGSSYATSSYQPYIPAAYQEQTTNRTASIRNSYFATSLPQQTYGQPPPPPPLPPRPYETSYATPGQGYGYQYEPQSGYNQSYTNSYNSPRSQPLHSPTTAPAPPPPPHHETIAARPYSHSFSNTASTYMSSSPGLGQGSLASPGQQPAEINRNHSSGSRISNLSGAFASSSPQPSIPTPPSRNASRHSPQRSGTERHPQGRTLPGLPSESSSDNDYFVSHPQSALGYGDLTNHIDAAISTFSGVGGNRQQSSAYEDPLFPMNSPQLRVSPDERPTHLNGIISTGGHTMNYGAFANDSDAEAAAGLAAMQAADEQEAAEEARRRDSQVQLEDESPRQSDRERSDESDYAGYDLSLAGGGYAGTMHYGDENYSDYAEAAAAAPPNDYTDKLDPRMNSVRSSGLSSDGRTSQASGVDFTTPSDLYSTATPFRTDIARVDTGGTGGLTEPSPHPRRMSYEDGDEYALSSTDLPSSSPRDSLPDLFFHPGMSQQRPLPPPPSSSDPGVRNPHLIPAGTYIQQSRFSQYDQSPRPYPSAPDMYYQDNLTPSAVPRSTSLASTRSVPKPDQPTRSKTDADRARILKQQQAGRTFSDVYDSSSPPVEVTALDLPALPKKKFNASKLSIDQFKRCSEPWALSSVLSWIRDLAEEETDLKESAVAEAITALFINKVSTMNTTEAEALGEKIVSDMVAAGVLVRDEEWIKFGDGDMSGVLFQLTGIGCYAPKLHLQSSKGRCYSHHCMRTSKKVDLSLPTEKKEGTWQEYYKLSSEVALTRDKKEIERQNVLHEVVTSEESFIASLDVIRDLYRDVLTAQQPPIIPAKRLPGFLRDVFGLVDKVKKVNEDFLLAQLKYRQNEQGPWIVGFSDIFREWIRRARSVYSEYAAAYPRADWLVREEEKRNLLFKQFLDQARQDRRSNRLSWDSYLKGPITRIQRYVLLLGSIHKLMIKDSEEKTNLEYALDEIKAATHEADIKKGENDKKVELSDLSRKIKLRRPMERDVDLSLDHLGRTVILRGDLQRQGGNRINWVDTHAILFDHYLVLAKLVIQRDSAGVQRQEVYDVSKTPIPMDLIVLESTNDPAVVKSSMRGIAAVSTTVAPRGQTTPDPRLARTTSGASGNNLVHTNTGLSGQSGNTNQSSIVTSTNLEGNSKDDRVLYPFKIKHLGKPEVYTLYATTAEKRQDWCEAIINAKTQHAESLFAQNAEPFALRVLADTAFGLEGYPAGQRRIVIRGTPLDRSIQDVEKRYEGQGRPAPVCRASVNCATVFQQPYGRFMCAVGTDYGVFISEYQNPRGWIRSIPTTKVTQVTVLEEFNLFLLIADKVLIAYHLDAVCPPSGPLVPQNDATARKAPQQLSGSKDVGFFVAGKMKDRVLVFYKKKDGIHSRFKVLEPVLQKNATSRSKWLGGATRRGQTEFFRDYDEFYIPAECFGLNLFHSSLAVSTQRGVEVLTLDKKLPWTVPNLRSDSPETQAHLSSIATRIKDLRPLGMFRLSEAEFLVAFSECAVYVNKTADISRGVVMEFVGRANAACLYGLYLILFNDDHVEIRDAQNGRLKQVIAGKDIRMLDDGGNAMPGSQGAPSPGLGGGMNGLAVQSRGAVPKTVKVSMQHPEYEKSYVIVELIPAVQDH